MLNGVIHYKNGLEVRGKRAWLTTAVALSLAGCFVFEIVGCAARPSAYTTSFKNRSKQDVSDVQMMWGDYYSGGGWVSPGGGKSTMWGDYPPPIPDEAKISWKNAKGEALEKIIPIKSKVNGLGKNEEYDFVFYMDQNDVELRAFKALDINLSMMRQWSKTGVVTCPEGASKHKFFAKNSSDELIRYALHIYWGDYVIGIGPVYQGKARGFCVPEKVIPDDAAFVWSYKSKTTDITIPLHGLHDTLALTEPTEINFILNDENVQYEVKQPNTPLQE